MKHNTKKSAGGSSSREMSLWAGVAEGVITPPAMGTFLIGPMAASTGVHDDLWARVLVLGDSQTRVVLVTMDYLGFDFAFSDVLVDAVSAASDLPRERILLNCSHTHNAPLTIPWGPWEKKKDKEFHKTLPVILADLTRQACASLQPATIRYWRTAAQAGFNRRLPTESGVVVMADNHQGVVLPWADVLQVKNADNNNSIAVLVSHAAHPVIVHAASTLISADYPGFAMAALRELRGDDCVCMFAQGCGSNINGAPLQGGFEAARSAGEKVAQAVHEVMTKEEGVELHGPIRLCSGDIAVSLAPPPSKEVCERWLSNETDPMRIEALQEMRTMTAEQFPTTKEMRIRGLALGSQFCLLGLSHEVFADYARFVETHSPFPYNVVLAYTNGVECYVGTETEYRLGEPGGYETSPKGAALCYAGGLPLAPRAEKQIQEGLLHVLKALRS